MPLAHWLQQTLASHSLVVLLLAFAGGVASSLLPCTVAMLPVLIGYMGGYSGATRQQVLLQTLLFTVGIAAVMTMLGILASLLGLTFGGVIGSEGYYAVGALAILMGLQLLGVLHLPLPQLITKLPESRTGQIMTPLLLGMAFGLTASPCGTPFLTAILGFMSREHNIWLGGAGLFCYALGQGMLLLAAGLFTGFLKHLATLRRIGFVMNQLSGVVFLLAGLLLMAQASGLLTNLLLWLHWI